VALDQAEHPSGLIGDGDDHESGFLAESLGKGWVVAVRGNRIDTIGNIGNAQGLLHAATPYLNMIAI
jgi:hypothetical protein